MSTAKTRLHPTALVDPAAELADDVEVGPYCVIGPHVTIGAGTVIASHVVIEGHTTIGRRNRIAPFNAIGGVPQDKKYAGEPTRLEIGDDNVIREYGTFNVGTVQGGGVTRIGNDNWLMGYIHIAHDCIVGDHTIFANKTQLAGHVEVGDWVDLRRRLGRASVRARRRARDSPASAPCCDRTCRRSRWSAGEPPAPHGINVEGLKRRGFAPATVAALRAAYKTLYRNGLTLEEARTAIEAQAVAASAAGTGDAPATADALRLLNAFLGTATRGIVR